MLADGWASYSEARESTSNKEISDDWQNKIVTDNIPSLISKSYIYFDFIDNNPPLVKIIVDHISAGNPAETVPNIVKKDPEIEKLMKKVFGNVGMTNDAFAFLATEKVGNEMANKAVEGAITPSELQMGAINCVGKL